VQAHPRERERRHPPSAPARPANAPNCTAHFVGVNVSSSSPTAVLPISRQTGPLTSPGTLPRRSNTASMPNRQSSMISTAKRRVSELSTLSSTVRK
jgi:hypothetical protein